MGTVIVRDGKDEATMPCCDDPGCECNNPVCPECGDPLFGWETGPLCGMCEDGSDDEDDELQTPSQPG